ncbi:MAG: NRPS [Pycnora praestabilis]|nr:MAG: NRPS [Pycnora praestabilis]
MSMSSKSPTTMGIDIKCYCDLHEVYEPCFFPPNGGCPPESNDVSEIPVELDMTLLAKYHSKTGFSKEAIFLVAWTMVLRYYTGRGSIHFGVNSCDEVQTSLDVHGDNECIFDYRVAYCSAQVDRNMAIQDLIRCVQRLVNDMAAHKCQPVEEQNDHGNICDTWVLFCKDGSIFLDRTSMTLSLEIFLDWAQDSEQMPCKIYFDRRKISLQQAREVGSTVSLVISGILGSSILQVRDITLYSEEQRKVLVDRLESTPPVVSACLHHIIEVFARNTPNSPAVCDRARSFTYKELDDFACRMSGYLQELGVGPEVIVPVWMEKSALVHIALLGILKAGGAFVLLDPSHPVDRLESIINRVRAKVVVRSFWGPKLVAQTVEYYVNVTEETEDWLPTAAKMSAVNSRPESLAYVVFTSGSTGEPKGVMIEHASFVTSALAHGSSVGLSKDSRVLQFSSYAFDGSILELFTTLVHGGCVCVLTEDQRLSDIAAGARTMNVNTALLTPTMAKLVRPEDIPTLKTLMLGGEALSVDVVERWGPRVRLMQLYGPCETSVVATSKEMLQDTHPQNIGFSVGSSVWLVNLDDETLLVPTGTIGEILIKGPTVGRGYLGDPHKTVLSFIKQPDWFSGSTSGQKTRVRAKSDRLYRTGDLAYCEADGSIIFVGRKDNQIKLHGQRIEVGEIEVQLRKVIDTFEDVVVELIRPSGGTDILAAFVVTKKGTPSEDGTRNAAPAIDMVLVPWLAQIQETVARALPKHMCPTVYIPVPAIPTNRSGKADRAALRQRGANLRMERMTELMGTKTVHREPSTTNEMAMRALWSAVLGLDSSKIGADHSFFALGGDSVKVIKLVAAAREAQLVLTFGDVFEHPILSCLAKVLRDFTGENNPDTPRPFSLLDPSRSSRQSIAETTRSFSAARNVFDCYPSTPEQDRMLRESIQHPGAHVATWTYKLAPSVDTARFQKAWNIVVESLPILRTRMIDLGELASLQVVFQGGITWEEHDSPALNPGFGTPLASYAFYTMPPSDVRYSTMRTEVNEMRYFTLTSHHALFDGWSLSLVWDAVSQAYTNGTAPEALLPFNCFIKHSMKQNEVVADAFWRSLLEGAPASTMLIFPSKDYIPFQTNRLERMSSILEELSFGDVTISTIIRAAWALVLSYFEGSLDVTFRTTGTGRQTSMVSIENVAGPTLTSFPVRVRIDKDEQLKDFLARVQREGAQTGPYEYRGLENIRRVSASAAAACSFDSPYLICQTEDWKDTMPGLTKVSDKWQPSRTPLAVCAVPMKDAIRFLVGFDRHMISEDRTEELIKRLMGAISAMMRAMAADGGVAKVNSFRETEKGSIGGGLVQ